MEQYAIIIGVAVIAVSIYFMLSNRLQKTLVNVDTKIFLKIQHKLLLTHNTIKLILELPTPNHVLGLPIGSHIIIHGICDGENFSRPYTPITLDKYTNGVTELVIKHYKPDPSADYKGGKMGNYLMSLNEGDELAVSGPKGRISCERINNASVKFLIRLSYSTPPYSLKCNKIGMIAGGTGLTPMYQYIQEILFAEKNEIQIYLIYANRSEDDILLFDDLNELSRKYNGKLKIHYTIDRSIAPEDWKYDIGFIDKDMVSKHFPPPGEDTVSLMCGPPIMMKLMKSLLVSMDYTDERVVKY
ncbi:hypothetical protein A3Q56_02633 [Intoshia linei]|uniref:NADH-cytochrome b5 reductase n=1 Tax=Intoshia linei TaxID=1819745 RepID=A0A177B5R6_9BILA|nr:hypothetical protein A3Q56_02633 [Intoshia linei]